MSDPWDVAKTSGKNEAPSTFARRRSQNLTALRMLFGSRPDLIPTSGAGLYETLNVAADALIVGRANRKKLAIAVRVVLQTAFGTEWRSQDLSGIDLKRIQSETPLPELPAGEATNVRWRFGEVVKAFTQIYGTSPGIESSAEVGPTGRGLINFVQLLEATGELSKMQSAKQQTAVKRQLETYLGTGWRDADLIHADTGAWLSAEIADVSPKRSRELRSLAALTVRRFRSEYPDSLPPERLLQPGPTAAGIIDNIDLLNEQGKIAPGRAALIKYSLNTPLPAAYGDDWRNTALAELNVETLRQRDDLGISNRERTIRLSRLRQALDLYDQGRRLLHLRLKPARMSMGF